MARDAVRRAQVEARGLVNAAGPWVHLLLDKLGIDGAADVRLVKGSHIVVPKLYEGDHAYILQLPDRRIIFAIPWQGGTEIGTTDIPVDAPEDAVITRRRDRLSVRGREPSFRQADQRPPT